MRKRWLGEGGKVSVGCDGSADVRVGGQTVILRGIWAFGVWSLEGWDMLGRAGLRLDEMR
jgi:hypothetical protein